MHEGGGNILFFVVTAQRELVNDHLFGSPTYKVQSNCHPTPHHAVMECKKLLFCCQMIKTHNRRSGTLCLEAYAMFVRITDKSLDHIFFFAIRRITVSPCLCYF